MADIVSQNRYTYANNNPVNNIDPSGHSSASVNGINQYYDSNSLNQIRSYATATALWSAQLNAQNAFNNAVTTASNTAYQNYASINTISQATANSYINNGIAKAQQVSMNYGCSTGAVGNAAVERFKSVIEAAKSSANEKIERIKVNKGVEYADYLNEVKKESLKEVLDSNPPHEGSVVTEPLKQNINYELPYIDNSKNLLHLYEIKGILNQMVGYKETNTTPLFDFAWENFGEFEFVTDTTFQTIVNNDTLNLAWIAWKNAITKIPRPNNIGLGTWIKQNNQALQYVDDLIGPASTMAKVVKWVPYAGVLVSAGFNAIDSYQEDVPLKWIASDLYVDISLGTVSTLVSSWAGSSAGSAVGGAIANGPGAIAGAVAGTIAGLAVSGGMYFITDVIEIKGKSLNEWFKVAARERTDEFIDFINKLKED